MDIEPGQKFDVQEESVKLKKLVGIYDSDTFFADIAFLMNYIEPPRMPVYPFQGLDSPLRQLTYLAALNLSCSKSEISSREVPTNEAWLEIIKQTIKAKAGYYDLVLKDKDQIGKEFESIYKVAFPVFLDFFDTWGLNYEEQEIDRIETQIKPFDTHITNHLGISVEDCLSIYKIIDQLLNEKLNEPNNLIEKYKSVKDFHEEQIRNHTPPYNWEYTGSDEYVKEFIRYFADRGYKSTISKNEIKNLFDPGKVDLFFNLFSQERSESNFLFYTETNPILYKPIFKLRNGDFIVLDIKLLLYAINNVCLDFLTDNENLKEKYFERRGKVLHQKVADLFEVFFKQKAHIHNEYKTSENGDGQDVLVIHKGVALIIEVKSGKEMRPHSVPKDMIKLHTGIIRYFKKSIQEGFDQCIRVYDQFLNQNEVSIYNSKGQFNCKLRTKNLHHIFSIIVTQDKFRRPQIDLSLVLELDIDSDYPFSCCIDDFEVILLSMKKLGLGVSDLIRFLELREKIHGRIDCNDELEIWGLFLTEQDFSIPNDTNFRLRPPPWSTLIFDDLYNRGLGFRNEKNLVKKKSGKWMPFEPGRFYTRDKRTMNNKK